MGLSTIQILSGPEPSGPAVGVYLGSFDPPHRGHEWIAQRLLEQFGRVLLLLPATHFHKVIEPPRHATLAQRAKMLEALRAPAPGRISVGLAREVLFILLDQQLRARLHHARIGFAMGDETFRHLLDSRAYFERTGRPWGPREEHSLQSLRSRVIVLNRSGDCPWAHGVPDAMRHLSSTRVRRAAARLHADHASEARFVEQLSPWLPEGVAQAIVRQELYRTAALGAPLRGAVSTNTFPKR